ncbi:hypothetical protein GQ457_08G014610 [Hibiscus cannabinus]
MSIYFAALQPVNMSDNKVDIPKLTSENFKFWKESILLQLGCLDIDYAIRKPEPSITDNSNQADLALYEKWERSNCLSIMFIKSKVPADVRGSIEQYKNVQDLLVAIEKQFQTSQKSLASTLIMKFTSLKLTTVKGVRDHINKMRDLAARLKALEVEMSDSFLVHYILNTLPPQYGPFKISYNTHKDKWSIDELLTMCDQEEGRLILEMGESALTVTQGKRSVQTRQKGKAKIQPQADIKKEFTCFFCKKKGHLKKDRVKYKGWLEKKGKSISLVCFESNMVDDNYNTWWIDSGSTIHVSNSLQGLKNLREPVGAERHIYSGNKMQSHVKAIGTCELVLSSGFVLILKKTFYIPSFSRNLISVSRLVPLGYCFNLSNVGFSLFYKSEIVGNGVLCDGIYSIDLQNTVTHNVMHIQTGIKRCVINEDSSTLWHRRLGHISIERIKRLVNDGVLNTLDFTDFDTCADCIKGKQTNKSKKGAKRSSTILEIIHSDICCPDMDVQGQKYFITFIDDYSRYMYLYMLHYKSEALEAFKVFKAEVEKQCGKQIKIVRTDRGGEYYGRYTEDGQVPGPFAKFLQDNGIVGQYTMPGSPDQNGVAERRNRKCPKNEFEREQMKNIPYASVVGSLMYAQVCTRPDIAFAVGMLGRYQSNPGIDHWRAAKKVLRYLKGTKEYMLTYKRSDHLEVIGYSDSDFAGCVDSRKSTSGYIFMFASGAISWRSIKQTLTATSTMEAEFVSCFEATSHGIWV